MSKSFTKNQNYLRRIDGRLAGLRSYNPESSEIARMEVARADVMSRMSVTEINEYDNAMTRELTPAEKRAVAEADRIAMESNRDKPSI
jgi:hypothetical protein